MTLVETMISCFVAGIILIGAWIGYNNLVEVIKSRRDDIE